MNAWRPIATAAASPVAVPARTTAGGGTRSGSSARATTCAAGRKTSSQSSSNPTRGFRSGIVRRMSVPEGWREEDDALVREFELESFPAAIAFVSRLAELAERENHHPDIDIRYRRVLVRWSTHSAGGVTGRDRDMAARTSGELT